MSVLSASIKALGYVVSGICVAYGISYGLLHFHDQKSISVKGLSEHHVKANRATWTIGFDVHAASLQALYSKIQFGDAHIVTFLKKSGFKDSDIQMGNIAIYTNTDEKVKPDFMYNAHSFITLTTSNVDQVVLKMQKIGVLIQQGISLTSSEAKYAITNLNTLKPIMIKEAVTNAYKTAQIMLNSKSIQIGRLERMNQGLFTISDSNGSYDNTDPYKTVRVVVSAVYAL